MAKQRISELQLDRAIADKIAVSDDFRKWLLAQTKFASVASQAVLLIDEQIASKPRKKPENWWRHWWCNLEDGLGSETDIFVVFRFKDSQRRIALHIEDKPPHGKFTPNQWLNYRRRAEFMANNKKYMNYTEFVTVLMAPTSFLQNNEEQTAHFDALISYESLAPHIPLAEALAQMKTRT